jgi:F420-dependent oxidoreductase-like protein
MEVCLMVEGQEGETWQDWVALAQAAEQSGLDGLFRSDHYLSMNAPGTAAMDAWAILAGLASRTERIRLGTLVSPATFRHPSVLANMVTTVDHISNGRVELGLGAGWYEAEHRAFGFAFPPAATRFEVLEEQAEVISRQWTEDDVSFAGRHFTLEHCTAAPKPVQQPPPLIIGGSGKPRTVGAAVRFGAEYNASVFSTQQCGALRSVLDQACEQHGRDPRSLKFSAMAQNAVIGTSSADVERRIARVQREMGTGSGGLLSEPVSRWFTATTAEAVDRLSEWAAAGAHRVMIQHQLWSDLEMVALIGEEIARHVRDL